jgi:hypothetical protein
MAAETRKTLADLGLAPRGLTREQAAEYAGCQTLACFDDRIRKGLLPPASKGTHTWDRKLIDSYLDRASGLAPTTQPTALAEWREKRNARAS